MCVNEKHYNTSVLFFNNNVANYFAVRIDRPSELVGPRRVQRELRLQIEAFRVTFNRVCKRPFAPGLDRGRFASERADQLSNLLSRGSALIIAGTIAEYPDYLVFSQLAVVFLGSNRFGRATSANATAKSTLYLRSNRQRQSAAVANQDRCVLCIQPRHRKRRGECPDSGAQCRLARGIRVT